MTMTVNTGTCAKPGCAAVPMIREDINGSRCLGHKPERTYLLCERHDEDYFGRSGWLEARQAERIRRELIPFDEGDAR